MFILLFFGASPSGKAAGFGPAIRGFESFRPSIKEERISLEVFALPSALLEGKANTSSKRISDKKFIGLIYPACRSGILEEDVPRDNLLGIPQEGIASPILFNVYMHEFDEYIINELIELIPKYEKLSTSEKVNPKYNTVKTRVARSNKKVAELKETPNQDVKVTLLEIVQIIKNNPVTQHNATR